MSPSPPDCPAGRSRRHRCRLLVLATLCALALVAGTGGLATATENATVSVDADGVAARTNDTVYVWAGRVPAVHVHLRGAWTEAKWICLRAVSIAGRGGTTCTSPDNASTRAAFAGTDWYAGTLGRYRLVVTAQRPTGPSLTRSAVVQVIHVGGDVDDDGLSNRIETNRSSALTDPDTDDDGATDGYEYRHESGFLQQDDRSAGAKDNAAVSGQNSPVPGLLSSGVALGVGFVAFVLVTLVAGAYRTLSDGRAADESATDLAPDEQYVVRLLRERGGRMRQSTVVEHSGWSKAKVSRLLSEMEDDGIIRKITVGRENVVELQGDPA